MISPIFLVLFTILKFGWEVDSLRLPDDFCLYKEYNSINLTSSNESSVSVDFYNSNNTDPRRNITFTTNDETKSTERIISLDIEYEYTGWIRLYISFRIENIRNYILTIADTRGKIWHKEYFDRDFNSTFKVYGDAFMNCNAKERFFEITDGKRVKIPLAFDSDDIPHSEIWILGEKTAKRIVPTQKINEETKRKIVGEITATFGSKKFTFRPSQNETILRIRKFSGFIYNYYLSTVYKFSTWSQFLNGTLSKDFDEGSQQYYTRVIKFRFFTYDVRSAALKIYIKTAGTWTLEHPPFAPSISACGPTEAIVTVPDWEENWKIMFVVSVVMLVVQNCIFCCILIWRRFKKRATLDPPIYLDSVGPTAANDANPDDEDHIYDDFDPADYPDPPNRWRRFFKC